MSFDPLDAYTGGLSDCCGAPIMLGEMCSECKEHCNPQEEEEEQDNPEDLRADYKEDEWKDEGKRERAEQIEKMCRDAEAEDRKHFPELFGGKETI